MGLRLWTTVACMATWSGAVVAADATVGVTSTEIRIGQTTALSGPATSYGILAKTGRAYFRMVNDAGGINGRKVNLLVADDEYKPAKSMEAARKLVEHEQVALMYGSFGTATNAAQAAYLNQRGVPHLFLATGADQWGDVKTLPMSMGFQPSFRTEARIYTKHIIQTNPDPHIGVLYQNDDFGKDYLKGVQDVLGKLQAFKLVKAVAYESTDANVDTQVLRLKAAGVNYLVLAAIPKFAAQALRTAQAIDWKPTVYVSLGAAFVPATTDLVRDNSGITIYSGQFSKVATDPAWKNDPGMNQYRKFMAAYMPEADLHEPLSALAYSNAEALTRVLMNAGANLSRANIRRQAESLKGMSLSLLLPGITVNTAPDDHYPIEQLQLVKWTSGKWVRFGDVMSTSDIPWHIVDASARSR
jgi:branched-chain amino acid transport system substrate-binding protein